MNYSVEQVIEIAVKLARKQRVHDEDAVISHCRRICSRTRRRPHTAHDAATVAVELAATTQRRLAHGTGATDWIDLQHYKAR